MRVVHAGVLPVNDIRRVVVLVKGAVFVFPRTPSPGGTLLSLGSRGRRGRQVAWKNQNLCRKPSCYISNIPGLLHVSIVDQSGVLRDRS